MVYRLEATMNAPVPLERVFRLFEDPRNLAKITPPWLNFRILHPESVRMREGAEIDYLIRWLGVPMKWKTLITRYEPPHLFVDEQVRGPYTLWHHEHTFLETGAGVEIRDRVDYRLPLGTLGRIAHALVIRRQLLGIFRYRQAAIARLIGVPGISWRVS
jgi:ligand-binding SRPBCC domain-containing protein